MARQATSFRHSGKFPTAGLLIAAVLGPLAGAALGAVYTYGIVYIPFVYVNFLLTCGLGIGAGGAVVWLSMGWKIRNPALAGALGLLAGIAALWMAWAVDVHARFARGDVDVPVTFDPALILSYMDALYTEGSWSFKSTQASGVFLAGVWIVEALIVLGIAVALPWSTIANNPFCEACGLWTDETEGIKTLSAEGMELLLPRLLEGAFAHLEKCKPAAEGEKLRYRLDLASCAKCTESNYVALSRIETKVDAKGASSDETVALARNLPIRAKEVEILKAIGTAPPS